ncbi:MAG: gamma-glutamylcyclotransferase family protein [Romboutsia sp.]
MLIEKIFVYGSLRSDMFNYEKLLLGKVSKVEKGTIMGKLFHIENKDYPAVIPGEDIIAGELMSLKNFDKSLDELDELENYTIDNNINCEYLRKIVSVKLEDGSIENAYYYEYNPKSNENVDDNLIPVEHGDWKEYIDK